MLARVGHHGPFLHMRLRHLTWSTAHPRCKHNSTILHTPSLPTLTSISYSFKTSMWLNLIIMILSLHMTKPSQFALSYHICGTSNTKLTVKFCTSHSTHQVNATHIYMYIYICVLYVSCVHLRILRYNMVHFVDATDFKSTRNQQTCYECRETINCQRSAWGKWSCS